MHLFLCKFPRVEIPWQNAAAFIIRKHWGCLINQDSYVVWLEIFLNRILMVMNCFCGMIDRRMVLFLFSGWDYWRRYSPLQISNILLAPEFLTLLSIFLYFLCFQKMFNLPASANFEPLLSVGTFWLATSETLLLSP